MRRSAALVLMVALAAPAARAQSPLLGARAVDAKVSVKVFDPAGSVRITAWDKDSVVVRGRVAPGERFYLSGGRQGMKVGIMERADDAVPGASKLEIMVPRGSTVSVKAVTAEISVSGVSGWFYSVSGRMTIDGDSRAVDAQTITGDITVSATAPVVRAQSGDGKIVLRGAPEDVDVSTVGGAIEIAAPAIVRGRFASVSGEIDFAGAPAAGGVLDFTDHAGAVVLTMPRDVAGVFELSTISGTIENGMSSVRAVGAAAGQGGSIRIALGVGGGRVVIRTFRGAIALRPNH